jgi:hypothetical protein
LILRSGPFWVSWRDGYAGRVQKRLDDLARVMAADILETLSLEDIQQLIAEMEAEQRKLN